MKNILIIYPSMIMGGSTTSLIAFLNAIDKERYRVDLQLYKNEGPLIKKLPQNISVLDEAFMFRGVKGKMIKMWLGIKSGYLNKAFCENKRLNKKGLSQQMMAEFQAKYLSKKLDKHYDIAISFLEGWSNIYLAWCVKATKKIAWFHSTFRNVSANPMLEENWMRRVDKISFVSKKCVDDFKIEMPNMGNKAILVENIIDSDVIREQIGRAHV